MYSWFDFVSPTVTSGVLFSKSWDDIVGECSNLFCISCNKSINEWIGTLWQLQLLLNLSRVDTNTHTHNYICIWICLLTLTPIRPQKRPDPAPPPAVAWAYVYGCSRSDVATGLDYKPPGVKQACMIGQLNRCLVLWSCRLHNWQSGCIWI